MSSTEYDPERQRSFARRELDDYPYPDEVETAEDKIAEDKIVDDGTEDETVEGGADILGGSDILGGYGCCDGGDEFSYHGGMESQLNLKTEAILFIDAVLVVFVVVLIVSVVGAYYVDDKVTADEYNDPNYESVMSKVTSIPLHVVGGLIVARVVVGSVM